MKVTSGDIGSPALVEAPPGGFAAEPRPVRFTADDGQALVGHVFAAERPAGGVLIAPATGVPARLYHAFARWLAEARNLTCLTFDYRGIGASLDVPLARCEARLQDWGELDMVAALEHLRGVAPGPYHLVGHSAGGQLVGLMRNVGALERIVQVASSSGYFPQLQPRLRIPARILMQGYLPLSNWLLGYAACKRVGWGEDLPRAVATQWTQWCSRPGYVENAFGRTVSEHHYDRITAPILNLSFTDDTIATEANIEDLLRLFPRARVERRRYAPEDLGMQAVGHIDFFRRRNRALWPEVADFLHSS